MTILILKKCLHFSLQRKCFNTELWCINCDSKFLIKSWLKYKMWKIQKLFHKFKEKKQTSLKFQLPTRKEHHSHFLWWEAVFGVTPSVSLWTMASMSYTPFRVKCHGPNLKKSAKVNGTVWVFLKFYPILQYIFFWLSLGHKVL